MTRQAAIAYITAQLTQKAAELAPVGYLGSVKTTYKGDRANVFMTFGTDSLSISVAADVFSSANVRVAARVKNRSGKTYLESEDFVYHYRDNHSRTDIKRWCIERFAKKTQDALTVFKAELAKGS